MAKSKKPRKKHSTRKELHRLLNGMVMQWTVEDPLNDDRSTVIHGRLKHRNSLKDLCLQGMKQEIQLVVTKIPLKWRVDIEVEFKDDFGKQYFRGAEMLVDGVLNLADEDYFGAIEGIFQESNMAHYEVTHVTAECLGHGVIKKSDFAA